MARSRNIKPAFFQNEYLADLSPHARLLFVGLWCLADREGRLEDRPKKIKGELFPYEDVDTDGMLNLLKTAGFINRYEVDGIKCIQVVNFIKHQNPHKYEQPSTLPECTSNGKRRNKAQSKHVQSTTKVVPSTDIIGTSTDKNGTTPADSLSLDSPIPHTDSPILDNHPTDDAHPADALPPERKRNKLQALIEDWDAPDSVKAELWKFVSSRREMKKPVSFVNIEALLPQLETMGWHSAAAALNYSVANGTTVVVTQKDMKDSSGTGYKRYGEAAPDDPYARKFGV
jgi:hypothetical protein